MVIEKEKVIKIKRMAYTPVKGAAMVETQTAKLTPGGLCVDDVQDRTWMVVDAEPDEQGRHRFVTQRGRRGLGKMALIEPSTTLDTLQLTWDGSDPISVPKDLNFGKDMKVKIWDEESNGAIDQGNQVAEWLSDHLGRSLRLVKASDKILRPESRLPAWQDSFALHWLSQESITELSTKVGQDLTWRRFRPNILVEGVHQPDYEHTLLRGSFGEVAFKNQEPCDRCSILTVNPKTGERDIQGILKVLGEYKSWENPDGQVLPIFGEKANILGHGEISVGQEVTIIDFRSPALVYGSRV